jgi:hypothetical protein
MDGVAASCNSVFFCGEKFVEDDIDIEVIAREISAEVEADEIIIEIVGG